MRRQARRLTPRRRSLGSAALLVLTLAAPATALDGRRLRVADGKLVDGHGREITLRGVNARVAGIFDVTFDDGRLPLEPIPTFDAGDADRMRDLGFDLLRLAINWSGRSVASATTSARSSS